MINALMRRVRHAVVPPKQVFLVVSAGALAQPLWTLWLTRAAKRPIRVEIITTVEALAEAVRYHEGAWAGCIVARDAPRTVIAAACNWARLFNVPILRRAREVRPNALRRAQAHARMFGTPRPQS